MLKCSCFSVCARRFPPSSRQEMNVMVTTNSLELRWLYSEVKIDEDEKFKECDKKYSPKCTKLLKDDYRETLDG